MTGRCDEVEQNVDTVIPEAGVTLNPGLLCKNVIVLALEVADDLAEAVQKLATELTSVFCAVYVPGLVVDLVTEPRGIDDGQGDTGPLLIEFKLCHLQSVFAAHHWRYAGNGSTHRR